MDPSVEACDDQGRRARRAAVLVRYGAQPDEVEELLAYNEKAFDATKADGLAFPLPDEPLVEAWRHYVDESRVQGAWAALSKRLAPFWFPIREGISASSDYRAAGRQGRLREALPDATGLALQEPDKLLLTLWPTAAGHLPILTTSNRADFVAVVQALAYRNEPKAIPSSMGAIMVAGLNNWDRIRSYRREWERRQSAPPDEAAWQEEFKRLTVRKELYQDRLIVLSGGAYSGVPAEQLGLTESRWSELSLALRREHECTHYFTRRVFGAMRDNLFDEILADYAALVKVQGCFQASWLLRFLGLEAFPEYRQGGRLQNYLGETPLSEGPVRVLRTLVHQAAQNLERFEQATRGRLDPIKGFLVLAGLTLEEMASEEIMASSEI